MTSPDTPGVASFAILDSASLTDVDMTFGAYETILNDIDHGRAPSMSQGRIVRFQSDTGDWYSAAPQAVLATGWKAKP